MGAKWLRIKSGLLGNEDLALRPHSLCSWLRSARPLRLLGFKLELGGYRPEGRAGLWSDRRRSGASIGRVARECVWAERGPAGPGVSSSVCKQETERREERGRSRADQRRGKLGRLLRQWPLVGDPEGHGRGRPMWHTITCGCSWATGEGNQTNCEETGCWSDPTTEGRRIQIDPRRIRRKGGIHCRRLSSESWV